jgi:hypothetical protein
MPIGQPYSTVLNILADSYSLGSGQLLPKELAHGFAAGIGLIELRVDDLLRFFGIDHVPAPLLVHLIWCCLKTSRV